MHCPFPKQNPFLLRNAPTKTAHFQRRKNERNAAAKSERIALGCGAASAKRHFFHERWNCAKSLLK